MVGSHKSVILNSKYSVSNSVYNILIIVCTISRVQAYSGAQLTECVAKKTENLSLFNSANTQSLIRDLSMLLNL